MLKLKQVSVKKNKVIDSRLQYIVDGSCFINIVHKTESAMCIMDNLIT